MYNRRSTASPIDQRRSRLYSPQLSESNVNRSRSIGAIDRRSSSRSRLDTDRYAAPRSAANRIGIGRGILIKPHHNLRESEFNFGNSSVSIKSTVSFIRNRLNMPIIITSMNYKVPVRVNGRITHVQRNIDLNSYSTENLTKYGHMFMYRTLNLHIDIPYEDTGPSMDICSVVKYVNNLDDAAKVINPDRICLPQTSIPSSLLQQSISLWKRMNKDIDINAWLVLISEVRDKVIFMSEVPYMNDKVKELISDEMTVLDDEIGLQLLVNNSPSLLYKSAGRVVIGPNAASILVSRGELLKDLKGFEGVSRTDIMSIMKLLTDDFDYFDFVCRNPYLLKTCHRSLSKQDILGVLCIKKNISMIIDNWNISEDDSLSPIEDYGYRAYEMIDAIDMDFDNAEDIKKLIDKYGYLLNDDAWISVIDIYGDFNGESISNEMKDKYKRMSRSRTAMEAIFTTSELAEISWTHPRGFLLDYMNDRTEGEPIRKLEMAPVFSDRELDYYIDAAIDRDICPLELTMDFGLLDPVHYESLIGLYESNLLSMSKIISRIRRLEDVIPTPQLLRNVVTPRNIRTRVEPEMRTRVHSVVMDGVEVEVQVTDRNDRNISRILNFDEDVASTLSGDRSVNG